MPAGHRGCGEYCYFAPQYERRLALPTPREDLNQQKALRKMRISRIILPIILGVIVVIYLLWGQFDPEEFRKIEWSRTAWIWLSAAVVFLVVRHLAYSARLRILSQGEFSWRKCIELIFIWEFSSAVSPTSVGGSAVALFVLSHEKLSTARTTAIVLYTIVLDTLFFISSIPVYYLLFGPSIVRPGLVSFSTMDGWAMTFLIAYIFMALYGAFFFYALFVRPDQGRVVLHWIGSLRIFRRWRWRIVRLGAGFVEASRELKRREIGFHLKAFLSTAVAWSMRFLLINCLIIAIVNVISLDFFDQFKLFARLQTMFVILAFSPTPGGAGFHEFVFGDFLRDYVPAGIA
ncbi:MAG: lysylphosphatidylglycerol synthase transmembrane domain-containing protein, partial [Saprospiraceae bacterium]|nr:lysylphosphatidylglycerol synthase transmembrane domain-containing protein [Saprospiraceae bacterium]